MTLVIGIGNADRGDDAAGLAVVRAVRAAVTAVAAVAGTVTIAELAGDQLGLLDLWAGAGEVIVIDAVCSGAPPGTVFRFTADRPLAHAFTHAGTHTFSLADVIELARNLDELPSGLAGYGIEGRSFGFGEPLSAPVAAAVADVTGALLTELKQKAR